MTRPGYILALVLALQLLLTAALFWPREEAGQELARTGLFAFASADIDRVTVSDGDNTAVLARKSGGWIMPEYHDLAVDSARMAMLLKTLPTRERGWPVASRASAAERFEVAEDNFQRRVEYMQEEDSVGVLYLGSSPGFRRIHTRIDDESPIYSVEFNTFDAPAESAEWIDKTLLQVKGVRAIKGLDFRLTLKGGEWTDAKGNVAAKEEAEELVNGLTGLRVTAAADDDATAALEEMDTPPSLTVTSSGGEFQYRLFEIEEDRYVQRTDIPVYFSLSTTDYDRLNDPTSVSLFPEEDEEDETSTQ